MRPPLLPALALVLALSACTSRVREAWDNALGLPLPSSAKVESVDVLRYGDVLAAVDLPKADFPAFADAVQGFAPWTPAAAAFSVPVGDRSEKIAPETCTLYTHRHQPSGKELYLIWDERKETVWAVLFQP